MTDINGTPRPARKRRRPAVVCAECRRRKIACDRKTPCGQCALHNVECVYVTGSVPPPYGRPLRAPVSPGSQPGLVVPGERNDLATGNVPPAATAAGTTANASATGTTADAGPNGPTATTSPLDEEEEVAPGAELTNTMVSLGERSSRFGGRLAKTRLFGRTHWMNNMDEFKDIHSLTHLVHFVTGSVIYKSMRTCKRIARVIKADELARIAAPLEEGEPLWLTVPPRPVADRLVELYFNVFEPQFRILHMPTFRREYEAFMEEQDQSQPASPSRDRDPGGDDDDARRRKGDPPTHTTPKNGQGGASADFMVKLVLVLAMGSCFYDGEKEQLETSESPDSASEKMTAAAAAAALHDQLRIAAARAVQRMDVSYCAPLDKHRLNLDTLQIYCLVTLARQTTALDLGDDLTWFTTGGLLHTAFGMGLNRDPSHFKSLSFAQSEMRRRLWATILELVVQASLDQGMPPLISTDDYDCAPPLNLDDDAFGVGNDSGSLEGNAYDHIAVDLPIHGVAMPGQGTGHGATKKRKGGPGANAGPTAGPKPRTGGASDGLGAGNIGTGESLLPRGEQSFRRPAAPRKGHPDTVFTHTSMQRLLCRSLPIRLRTTKALNGLGAGLTYERALQLSADLLETCRYAATTLRAAPLMWKPATADFGEAATEKQKAALEKERVVFAKLRIAFYEILTRRFHHSLHSPFARKAGNNVQFFYSRRARIETVLRLLSFFRQPTTHATMLADVNTPIASDESTATELESGIPLTLVRPTAAEDPCRRLWLIGRGMLKCTMVDIKATAVIEMIHQLQEDYVPGSDLTLSQRELYDTVRTIIELAHARIEAGETNVKGYLFFRGALAQVDALMQGKPVRQVIIEAAQSSSTKTINTLKNLAARRGVALPDDLGGTNLGDDLDPPSISPVALQTDEIAAGVSRATPATTVAPALTTNGNSSNIYTANLNNLSNNSPNNNTLNNLSNTAFAGLATTNPSTAGPSPSQILGMTEMGTVTFSDLERGASSSGMHTHLFDGSGGGGGGGGGGDVDSGIHLPSADGSHTNTTANTNTSQNSGPWVDEWLMMDPPGDFGLGNWFFPYNDRINNS
ncbi:hypothetical protein Sste5346_002094 [Sporothrix stenoceras]|uniref:Zn(2)-C6 fungal-type domain-containing protein n=1 Tax=Sporothrix stenoceras TaxID=5173 RepID=A0ABR3ZKU8_9PEZI